MEKILSFGRWLRVTATGWLIGIPLVIALALLGETVGIGGVQVLVGLGIGAGIGWRQGLAMREVLGKFGPWFWACVISLALPFLAADLANLVSWNVPYFPYSCIVLCGLIVGVWQARLLRARFEQTEWWIAGSVLGWSLAAGLVGLADAMFRARSIRGIWGALLYLGCLAGGGLILGLVTGLALTRLRPRETTV